MLRGREPRSPGISAGNDGRAALAATGQRVRTEHGPRRRRHQTRCREGWLGQAAAEGPRPRPGLPLQPRRSLRRSRRRERRCESQDHHPSHRRRRRRRSHRQHERRRESNRRRGHRRLQRRAGPADRFRERPDPTKQFRQRTRSCASRMRRRWSRTSSKATSLRQASANRRCLPSLRRLRMRSSRRPGTG